MHPDRLGYVVIAMTEYVVIPYLHGQTDEDVDEYWFRYFATEAEAVNCVKMMLRLPDDYERIKMIEKFTNEYTGEEKFLISTEKEYHTNKRYANLVPYELSTDPRTLRYAPSYLRQWEESTWHSLSDAYKTGYSAAKGRAWRHYAELCESMGGDDMKVISKNTWQYSLGFKFTDDATGVLCFYYATPNYGGIIEM